MEKEKNNYLNAIYQNCSTAMQSIKDLLDSVKNEKLKSVLKSQYEKYEEIHKKCEKYAVENEIDVKDNNWFEKARLWTSIKMTTMMDDSTRHFAEMLLLGTVMGLNVCYKDRWDHQNLDKELDGFLNELEVLEEECYKEYKQFLRCDLDKEDEKECNCGCKDNKQEDCNCYDDCECIEGEENCGCKDDKKDNCDKNCNCK